MPVYTSLVHSLCSVLSTSFRSVVRCQKVDLVNTVLDTSLLLVIFLGLILKYDVLDDENQEVCASVIAMLFVFIASFLFAMIVDSFVSPLYEQYKALRRLFRHQGGTFREFLAHPLAIVKRELEFQRHLQKRKPHAVHHLRLMKAEMDTIREFERFLPAMDDCESKLEAIILWCTMPLTRHALRQEGLDPHRLFTAASAVLLAMAHFTGSGCRLAGDGGEEDISSDRVDDPALDSKLERRAALKVMRKAVRKLWSRAGLNPTPAKVAKQAQSGGEEKTDRVRRRG